ncbi:MAG: hypothetical protein KQH63_12550 [Desulfobulbaceae bacterium]|nr:hypothetical protein [Desulfobulbaceae bacterium]
MIIFTPTDRSRVIFLPYRFFAPFCFFLLVFFFTSPPFLLASDPLELESKTVKELLLYYDVEELLSVSFYPTAPRKAPGYSYVITEEEIKESPARTLADIIDMKVPGMTTGGHIRHGPLTGTRGVFIDNNAKPW